MTNEELLKSISTMLKKHENYLQENPELFLGIQDRLLDAIGYGDPEVLEKDDKFKISDGHHSMLMDALGHAESPLSQHSLVRETLGLPAEMHDLEPPAQAPTMGGSAAVNSDSHHDNMTSATLRQFKPNHISSIASDIYEALNDTHDDVESTSLEEGDTERYDDHLRHMTNMKHLMDHHSPLKKSKDDKPKKVSRTGYRDWQPKDKYEDHHQVEIEKLMGEGWSHREAERMAGAHDGPKDFAAALEHRVNPSHPSDKMLEIMREHAKEYKQRADKVAGKNADPAINPQLFGGHKTTAAHEEAYGDYNKDYKAFLSELDDQDLHPLDYDEAVSNWQKDWHEKNPDAKANMLAVANAGKEFDVANQARKEKLDEGALNIVQGGNAAGADDSTSSEFSEAASGGQANDFQAAAQMIGGAKGEGGYEAGMVKDPAAIFKEQNPEFVAELKRKMAAKLGEDPAMKQRHDAMPTRERTVKTPSPADPAPVKKLSPEEIQAQYGDKYNVKPKGGQ